MSWQSLLVGNVGGRFPDYLFFFFFFFYPLVLFFSFLLAEIMYVCTSYVFHGNAFVHSTGGKMRR